MNAFYIWIGLGLLAGALLPLQAGINNPLRAALGHPLLPALVTFGSGALLLLGYALALRLPLAPSAAASRLTWWHWIGGGFCGSLFVTLVITLAPRLGSAVLFALIVTGEIGLSLLLDHYGWLSFPVHPMTAGRLIGAVLLIGGVILIHRF